MGKNYMQILTFEWMKSLGSVMRITGVAKVKKGQILKNVGKGLKRVQNEYFAEKMPLTHISPLFSKFISVLSNCSGLWIWLSPNIFIVTLGKLINMRKTYFIGVFFGEISILHTFQTISNIFWNLTFFDLGLMLIRITAQRSFFQKNVIICISILPITYINKFNLFKMVLFWFFILSDW